MYVVCRLSLLAILRLSFVRVRLCNNCIVYVYIRNRVCLNRSKWHTDTNSFAHPYTLIIYSVSVFVSVSLFFSAFRMIAWDQDRFRNSSNYANNFSLEPRQRFSFSFLLSVLMKLVWAIWPVNHAFYKYRKVYKRNRQCSVECCCPVTNVQMFLRHDVVIFQIVYYLPLAQLVFILSFDFFCSFRVFFLSVRLLLGCKSLYWKFNW